MCNYVLPECMPMNGVHTFSLEASRGLGLMELELQTAVSSKVNAGNPMKVLWKSSQCFGH